MRNAIQEVGARDFGLIEVATDRVISQAEERDLGVVGGEALQRRTSQRVGFESSNLPHPQKQPVNL